GSEIDRRAFLAALSDMQYQRTDIEWKRGLFRARGDAIEVWPAYERYAVRIELFGDEIERVDLINPTSGEVIAEERQFFLFPAVHYVMPEDRMKAATGGIREELEARVLALRSEGRLLEAQRLLGRTKYDLEMIEEVGFCQGIENYSRWLDGRQPGERPFTLMDYFDYSPPADDRLAKPRMIEHPTRQNLGDWLLIIDESHVTVPQINAMFNGDKNRKEILVQHGFRLPSAMDNRPLRFE
ncbi:MAG: excinuclease ABC subunit B, partial [Planctomycetota bacterium]